MNQNKMTAPVLAHRDGQNNELSQKLKPILPLLRAAVKTAAVTLGLYILAAVAALDLPAVLLAVLIENALLGAYFALGEVQA